MSDARIGQEVGRYRIASLLAAGANSRVYVAHDAELDRWVALKVVETRARVPAVGSHDTPFGVTRADVVREARALARASHPNLVAVFEVGDLGDAVYIAMELATGQTLSGWLAERPRPVEEILAIFAAAGAGLAAAHAAGIVHGDFKPDNVVVEPGGRVRVVDFGLARVRGAQGGGDRRFAGTPRFMAREQFLGEPVCERTDQFAFCVALYRALYGEWAFAGTSVPEISYSVVHTDPRRPTWRRGTRGLERAVMTGLAMDRAARHASMGALLQALAHSAPGRKMGTPFPGRP
jgi:eukaryotic-like serine/threonine-protein kinase